jgi:hypothetical protein
VCSRPVTNGATGDTGQAGCPRAAERRRGLDGVDPGTPGMSVAPGAGLGHIVRALCSRPRVGVRIRVQRRVRHMCKGPGREASGTCDSGRPGAPRSLLTMRSISRLACGSARSSGCASEALERGLRRRLRIVADLDRAISNTRPTSAVVNTMSSSSTL